MINRRDFVMGGACVASAATAYALVPRKHASLLGKRRMQDIVPRTFGGWTSRDESNLVAPKIEDSLASKLYGETVGRVYFDASEGAAVLMLLAHGDTQSDDLQLHRPEICYPAFGFAVSDLKDAPIPLNGAESLPARRLVARGGDRQENIVYWSRLGEYFPRNRKQQQIDRLRTAMDGYVSDGLLARFSVLGADQDAATAVAIKFIQDLITATPANQRAPLVGTARARALAKV